LPRFSLRCDEPEILDAPDVLVTDQLASYVKFGPAFAQNLRRLRVVQALKALSATSTKWQL